MLFSICTGLLFGQSGNGGAAVAGTVLDQVGNVIPNATVTLKNGLGDSVREVNAGEDGHFSFTSLPAGKYTIEVAAPGFAVTRRTDMDVSPGRAEDLSISLSVASVNQSVTVEGAVSLAAQLAPSGNTLEATSARTEISKDFIQNFTSPLADFNEVGWLSRAIGHAHPRSPWDDTEQCGKTLSQRGVRKDRVAKRGVW